MGDGLKGCAKVRVDNIHSPSPIHSVGHLVIEGDQASPTGPAYHKPMLAGPHHLAVLYVPRDGTQDDLLHKLPRGQADGPWTFLPAPMLMAWTSEPFAGLKAGWTAEPKGW